MNTSDVIRGTRLKALELFDWVLSAILGRTGVFL